MVSKLLSMAIATALLLAVSITSVPARAQAQSTTDPTHADRIRAKVVRVGIGRRATVTLTLKDNSKLKGYIGQIAEDGFTVVNPNRGTVTPVPYEQVQQINSTNRSWIFPLVAAVGTVVGVMLLVVLSLRGS